MAIWVSGLLLACAAGLAQQGEPAVRQEEPVVVECSSLRLEIHLSETALLFHAVDQISEWSEFTHGQYRGYFHARGGLSEEDRRQLARHAELRRRRGWGGGPEQTFYSPLPLDEAIAAGVAAGHLSQEEGALEREVLMHFRERVAMLSEEQRSTVVEFRDRLVAERERICRVADGLAAFCQVEKATVPVYLLANPSDRSFGGGFNGGRLTLEPPRERDAFPTFLHEVLHVFLEERRPLLEHAAASADGLDFQILNEGLAHAYAPGIVHAPGEDADPLVQRVHRLLTQDPRSEGIQTRYQRYALALRPLLRDALDTGQRLPEFLPRAVDAWHSLEELRLAEIIETDHYRSPHAAPSVFILGSSGIEQVMERLGELHCNRFGRAHQRSVYAEVFAKKVKPRDCFVLLLELQSEQRVPEEFADLLPQPWTEIEAALRLDRSVELSGSARGCHVLVLAAPDGPALLRLIAASEELGKLRPGEPLPDAD